jgi:dGTPase
LTHSLEVAQLARSLARSLLLNEDLVEAIALAHDLGHTPFGHAGQDALNECMAPFGGFEHNLQSLRVVDELEEAYPDWNGLNLCFETREGILKRCPVPVAEAMVQAEPGGVAQRFLSGQQASLEAQLTNLADEIAYNAHDIDDGVRSGLLSVDQLCEVPLFAAHHEATLVAHPGLANAPVRRRLAEVVRRMLSAQVYDVIAASTQALLREAPTSVDEVRHASGGLMVFSEEMRRQSAVLKRFLFRYLYRHPQVTEKTETGRRIIRELFEAYRVEPTLMPQDYAQAPDLNRSICDYIAGMTDRFAAGEHRRLTGQSLFKDDLAG